MGSQIYYGPCYLKAASVSVCDEQRSDFEMKIIFKIYSETYIPSDYKMVFVFLWIQQQAMFVINVFALLF